MRWWPAPPTFRATVDFTHFEHRYLDAVDHNWLTHHDPNGDWLYGADIGGVARLPAPRRRPPALSRPARR